VSEKDTSLKSFRCNHFRGYCSIFCILPEQNGDFGSLFSFTYSQIGKIFLRQKAHRIRVNGGGNLRGKRFKELYEKGRQKLFEKLVVLYHCVSVLFHCLIIAVSVQPWRISEKGIVLEAMKAPAKDKARVGESLPLWCDRTAQANPRYIH
jgi:hypothetical protein